MDAMIEKMDALFQELVPPAGKSESLAGEIVRAVSRIGYRFFNDGDRLGIGYGKETCNAAGRFLVKRTNETISDIVVEMIGLYDETKYAHKLEQLIAAVVEYIETNPQLRKEETEDMFSYFYKDEDVDDEEEEWY